MPEFKSGWYLIYTRPRHEKKVYDQLIQCNVNTYLPLVKKLHQWADRRKCIDSPLFPSYIFVRLNDAGDYFKGLNADGSLYYVKMGKEIVRVSETVVSNIKLAAGYQQDIEVLDDFFQPGQKMVIVEGALAGLSCELVEVKSKQMLLVRVDILQRNLLLRLPADHFMVDNSVNAACLQA